METLLNKKSENAELLNCYLAYWVLIVSIESSSFYNMLSLFS